MKSNFLIPYAYKLPGWILLSLGLLAGLYWIIIDSEPDWSSAQVFVIYLDQIFEAPRWFTFQKNTILDEMATLLMLIGGWMVAFSREKVEDEYVSKVRLESLVWALHVNYAILLVTVLLVFGLTFFYVLVFNIFTPLVIFIIRFRWMMWRNFRNSEV